VMIIVIPLVLLFRLRLGSPVAEWKAGRLARFAVLMAMFALAMNHVHALRFVAARGLPPWIYPTAHTGSSLILTLAVPMILLAVVCLWIVARRRAAWHGRDVAAVACGTLVLPLLCIVNSGSHLLDRVQLATGDAWQRFTCLLLPSLLVVVSGAMWAKSISDSSTVHPRQ